MVKTFASLAAMSATAWAGVGNWYRSRITKRLRCDKSTHMRILSEFFLGVTTIGAHHVVASVTGVITFCDGKQMVRGVCTQKGLAFAAKQIQNSSPCITLIRPSNTVGYLLITVLSFEVLVVVLKTLTLLVSVAGIVKIGVGWG